MNTFSDSALHSRLTRRSGPFTVWAIGLGCTNPSHAYGAPPPAGAARALPLAALDLGATLFDTAASYGFGASETLVGRVPKPHGAKFVLASKGGMQGVDGVRVVDGRPETVKATCDDSLRRPGPRYNPRHQADVDTAVF